MAFSVTGRPLALLLLVWIALGAPPAKAHAIIVAATPAVDAVVPGPSVAVELRFNSRIDHARSRVTLIGPGGEEHVLGLADGTPPDTLDAAATQLAPGAYRLRWQVLSIDGHITRGDIPFQVSG